MTEIPAGLPASPWPTVRVAGIEGYLFRAEDKLAFCFVPADCIDWTPEGEPQISEGRYFRSGWCLRNARQGHAEPDGEFTFPARGRPVNDFSQPEVKSFLKRISPPR